MGRKVTIQDIAEELGISRNTVSKAINNAPGLADATRERILKKAVEMGYKQFSYFTARPDLRPAFAESESSAFPPEAYRADEAKAGEIAVLTAKRLDYSHFASSMLDRFQQEIGRLGYSVGVYEIPPEQLTALALPPAFHPEQAAAVVCIEVFARRYAEMVCALGLPTLFIDGPTFFHGGALPTDQLYMENTTEISRLVHELIQQGKKRMGFVGDYAHCESFLERYLSLRTALMFSGVPFEEGFCVKSNDRQTIFRQIQAMPILPDVFLCANDFLAIDTLDALRELGKTVPGHVLLCGFDDSPESRRMMPPLTTVHIHTEIMAFSAVQLLTTRIREPNLDYRIVHTQTDLIRRESTRCQREESDG